MLKTLLTFRTIILFVLTSCFLAAPETFSEGTEPLHILMLGNSLTFMPDPAHPVTPAFVKSILDTQGIPADVEAITAGGHTLENHWREGEFQKRLQNKHYDYVFIQPYSIEGLELPACFRTMGPKETMEYGWGPQGREHFLEYARMMIDLVRSKHSIPIVIQPWTYSSGHAWLQKDFACLYFRGTKRTWYGGSLDRYQAMLDQAYSDLKDLTGVEVLRIGDAWKVLREAKYSELPMSVMFQEDQYHPTIHGAYFSALVISQRLSHKTADEFHFCPQQVNEKQEAILKKLAIQVLSTKTSSK